MSVKFDITALWTEIKAADKMGLKEIGGEWSNTL